jgi:ATP-dependent exoDNAse (exonuclease V) beta subunit
MVMNAKNVQTDKLLIQTTTRDASQEFATRETKSLLPETTATDATNAQLVTSQAQIELSATESSQLAAALRSMTQAVMSVFHAHHIKLLPMVTQDANQDNAQDKMKSSEEPTNAMPVNNANQDLLQINSEEDA